MSGRKHVLVTGVEFTNQGAFLMMKAIMAEVRERFNAVPVLDYRVGTREQRDQVGAGTYVPVRLEKMAAGPLVGQLLSASDKFVGPANLYAIFDGSGYRYGDAWKDLDLASSVTRYDRLTRFGVPLYFLPQALGPFVSTATIAERVRDNARLVFARDPDSLQAILHGATDAERVRIRLSPDFTGPLVGSPVPELRHEIGDVPIVPNWNISHRMSDPAVAKAYILNLADIVEGLRNRGLRPYGLSHEGTRDGDILREVAHLVPGEPLRVIEGLDGLQLKWVIGQAKMIVSARYHALASALCQGVPVVAHGWSHKYRWLLSDHGCESQLTDPFADASLQLERVDAALSSDTSVIDAGARRYKQANEQMWASISVDLREFWRQK